MKKLTTIIIFLMSGICSYAQKCNGVLLHKQGYTACYVDSLGHSQWVAWNLTATDIGTTDRQNDFRPDKDLPKGFYMVTPTDYRNSGFDKGHLCNSADRTSSVKLNQETFLMSNIIAQSPHNNEITWNGLEGHCRDLAKQGYELHIIAGAYGVGGEGKHGYKEKLSGKINVPSNTWKIVKYIKQGITEYIFVDIPNTQSLNKDWQDYQTTREDLQGLTGLVFDDF